MLDNRKVVLYSYPTFGHIAGQGCRLTVEKFSQEEKPLGGRRLRIGGINMRKMRSLWLGLVFVALVALLCGANAAWGQDVTATITGTITDASGAPLAGASVTAKDMDRGTVWPTTTNTEGIYNILRIPVGSYSLRVEAKGFQTALYPPFTLVLNQTARVDVQMKVGAVAETVEVTGETPLLQTQSTEVSTLVDATTVTSLPLAARNYIQLTLLSPGATNVNPSSMQFPQNMINSGRPYINGNREQANSFLLDGQINNESKNNETAYNPSVDAIQEFNLITQNASAEFGNYQGGVVSASIKSGTNSFHGDVFEFFRNDKLNSNNASDSWTQGVPAFENTPGHIVLGHTADGSLAKAELRYNMFGGTVGGPIIKDKLFFFADYQGQRLVNAGTTSSQLLTTSERAGDFGKVGFQIYDPRDPQTFNADGTIKNPGTPIPNNNIATYIASGGGGQPLNGKSALAESTVAKNLFSSSFYPTPQIDLGNENNFFYKSGNNLNNDQGDLKIDYILSQKDHIFGRYSKMDLRNPAFTGLPVAAAGSGANIDDPVRNAVLSWTHSFGTNLLNEVRIGFGAVHFDQRGTSSDALGAASQALGIAGGNDTAAKGLLNISISGTNGSASLGNGGAIQIFHTTEGQVEDNLNITHGRHAIRTGFQYWRERQDYDYGGNNGTLGTLSIATLTGSGIADFWLGDVGGGFKDGATNTLFGLRGNIFGAYVQDDWRITPTLTLNLGVRFEDHTPLYEVKDRQVNFNLSTGAIKLPGQNGNNRALYNNYLGGGDFLPRVGFAWSPAALGGKTVIRGGYAISEYMEGSGANEALTQNPPFFGATRSAVAGVGAIAQGFGPSVAPCAAPNFSCYAGKRIRVTDPNFRPALAQQWNLTIQHQFSNSLTVQVGYVGQHGTHLLNFFDATQLEGLNAAGKIAKPGEPIVSRVAGPFLGGGTPGSLYAADNSSLGGSSNIAGTNTSNANQRYDALQAVLQKRMSNGLQAQVAYTYSKCLSNSPGYFGTGWGSTQAMSSGGQPGWQNSYDSRSDWGPCYFDQKHILSSYVTYQLPVGRGKQFGKDMNSALNAVVGNWEIGGIVTMHTGNALTLNEFGGWGQFNGDPSGTNGIGNYFLSARPNCSGPLHTVDKFVPADPLKGIPAYIRWFDTSVVSHPANSFGTCSVGNGRGPGLAQVDMSLHKAFLLGEQRRLEFRAEFINLFNRAIYNFSGGVGTVPNNPSLGTSNPNFGNLTGSQGARNIQLALKFYF